MVIIKIMIIAVCATLWRMGGSKNYASWHRDILIPVVFWIYYTISCGWIIGFLTGGATNIIRLGYGAWDPEHDDKPSWLASVTHDREGSLIRGIYGAVTSFMIGLFPTIHYVFFRHQLRYIFFYILYILINTGLEFLLTKLKTKDIVHEPLAGAGRAALILCK